MTGNQIQVLINDSPTQLRHDAMLSDVLDALSIRETGGMAIAVNGKVVPKNNWEKHPLVNQDKVLVIRATQGG